ncbi:two component transcriptional regulator, winged helix family [Vulgatibacter incomptus]|uniref:Two component transcriptional regulator, winged helix family n=1 Tax=Vulgatibacter incomptus TaxID=1391653 RepID=A0A0K1PBK5_9BACT|nr:two component transcriptional regulator, winged helix family [Vulgatibacter incomptus]
MKANRLKAHKTPGGHRRIARDDLLSFLEKYQIPVPPELGESEEHPPRILAVDDDPDERDLLRAVLEGAGFDVELASSGFEAGLQVATFRPNLVVLDLVMPGMDGFAAIASLRARPETADTPVIACTGLSDPATSKKVVDAGFDAHVVKPYRAEDLLGAIQRLLGIRVGQLAG